MDVRGQFGYSFGLTVKIPASGEKPDLGQRSICTNCERDRLSREIGEGNQNRIVQVKDNIPMVLCHIIIYWYTGR